MNGQSSRGSFLPLSDKYPGKDDEIKVASFVSLKPRFKKDPHPPFHYTVPALLPFHFPAPVQDVPGRPATVSVPSSPFVISLN